MRSYHRMNVVHKKKRSHRKRLAYVMSRVARDMKTIPTPKMNITKNKPSFPFVSRPKMCCAHTHTCKIKKNCWVWPDRFAPQFREVASPKNTNCCIYSTIYFNKFLVCGWCTNQIVPYAKRHSIFGCDKTMMMRQMLTAKLAWRLFCLTFSPWCDIHFEFSTPVHILIRARKLRICLNPVFV